MQQTFNLLDGFYLHERCLLIDAIMEDQMRKRSAEEIEKINREINSRKKRKEDKYKISLKKPVLWIREPEQAEQKIAPPTRIQMRTNHIGEKQVAAKKKILEYINVGK